LEAGETPLAATFRETREEWFGGWHAPEVEVQLAECLPAGFDRLEALSHVLSYPDGWEFHTFLVTLARKFDPAKKLRLNAEFLLGSAAWFPSDDLPVKVRGTARQWVDYFQLRAMPMF
jgi:hypothetical protein